MTVNRTTLLDLPIITTGTESGLWGDYVNNGLTQYLDTSVAGALSITASVTLANTTGTNSATGITTTTAQYRTLVVPAAGVAANVVITAPSSNRTYHVVNLNGTYTVQIRAGANSGVTLGINQSATVTYDSVAGDYVLVGTIGPTVPVARGGTGATTLTSNNVILGNGTSAVQFVAPSTAGNILTSNGTTWTSTPPATSGTVTAVSVVSANGFAGTSSGGATPALTLSTSVSGLLKGNGTAISAAVSGTDYAPATSGTSILYGNGAGGFSNVTVGTGLTFSAGTLSASSSGGAQGFITQATGGNQPPAAYSPSDSFALI